MGAINRYIKVKKDEDILVNAIILANNCWKVEVRAFNDIHIPKGYMAYDSIEPRADKDYVKILQIYEADGPYPNASWLYEIYSTYQSLVIWKNTDESKNPEYKGDALSKVVPAELTDPKRIKAILKNQSWIYW